MSGLLKNIRKKLSNERYFLLGIAFVFVPVYIYIFDDKVGLLEDNLSYFILGKAIALGNGYTNVHFWKPSPATHFPPGYPLILAFFFRMFGSKILIAKILNGFFLLGSLCNFYYFFKPLVKKKSIVFLSVLLLLVNPVLLEFSTVIMSEIPFLFLSSLALRFVSKINFLKTPWRDWRVWLAGGLIGFALLTRTQGIAIVLSVFLYFILNKAWKHVLVYSATVVMVYIPWFLRGRNIGGSTYMKQLLLKNPLKPDLGYMEPGDWPVRFMINLERYILTEIPNSLFGFLEAGYKMAPGWDSWLFGIAILILIGIGWYHLKMARSLVAVYILGTLAILMVWCEVWEGPRFLVPVIPLFLFLWINGLVKSLHWLSSNYQYVPRIRIGWLSVLGLVFLPGVKRLNSYATTAYGNEFQDYFKLGKWVNKNLPDTVVIACRKPSLFYVFAERRVTNYPWTNDEQVFLSELNRKSVDFVVMDHFGLSSSVYLHRMAKRNPEKLFPIKKMTLTPTFLLKYDNRYGYEGEWNGDEREGRGKVRLPNGGFYEGKWKHGKRQGFGVFVWPNGRKYEGFWENNVMNGPGKMYNPEGVLEYDGLWENGKPKV